MKNIDKTLYTKDSILTLPPREFTRRRPSTYLGSNERPNQLITEIFSNALDEHLIGHGNCIEVDYIDSENKFRVKDYGQGFPINTLQEDSDETILQASFDTMNTSGKYDDDGVYGGSVLGLNGIGAKLTNFLSKELRVRSSDGKNYESLVFKDGILESRETGADKSSESGTEVVWYPDEQFFQSIEPSVADLKKLLEDQAGLNPSLTIKSNINGQISEFHKPRGLDELMDAQIHSKEALSDRFRIRRISGDKIVDICLSYSSDYSESTLAYVNFGLTESGKHINTLKSHLTKQINKFAREKGLLKKNEKEFGNAEYSLGMHLIFNIKTTNVKYDSQTKIRVVDLDLSLLNSVINNDFPLWLENHLSDVKFIIERARDTRNEKDEIQKLRDGLRNSTGKKKKKVFLNMPTKLVDADERKDRLKCELYITEGDSASNGLVAKRNGITQAIFPIRGKIVSVRKAKIHEIYGNQEIQNIIQALGLEVDPDTNKLIYDKKKLRYGKVIFATDADPDGYHIRLLLLNVFWWLCPELVTNGHIWVAIPPLYRITTKKNEYIYLTGNKELEEYKQKHKKESFQINRNKGLGEQDASELSTCILKPETRNIQQITVDDVNELENLLELLMGDNSEVRKQYIEDHLSDIE